ncbi:hypothetical protein CONPUDRAFT_168847 [Coniophora puteana RWD-64-598 SS2]|uniref:Uncharacterized protein n=1 Tax=Coniophora puteana (strain RWD-64-598) TaxID=741705 RepID=A0A5M3MAN7_CONPW|nr:uncharacterized protein CONPUDRAFT_168847 [Coniophora puteana RWD-64-598 SS2]EIW76279.1 hypothetical protein CONPUDRAFT_168847 [Coniophora puteana RWD-64-598 SS2]
MPQAAQPTTTDVGWACRCLNVQIHHIQTTRDHPPFLLDNDPSQFTPIFVGQDGPQITHPQMTLRSRRLAPHTSDASRAVRLTTLTCLLCQTLVYRVQQVVSPELDATEGPLLPSHEWVEQETLKSSTGWIEVHRSCLDSTAVAAVTKASTYSSVFGVGILPASNTSIPEQDTQDGALPSNPPNPTSPITPPPFLADLKPIFPPPPFTPSHPAFQHLSAIARHKSEALRAETERYLADVFTAKVTELEKAEDELRGSVEELWKNFHAGVRQAEREWNSSPAGAAALRSKSALPRSGAGYNGNSSGGGSGEMGGNDVAVASPPAAPLVSVKEFAPLPNAPVPVRAASSVSSPKMSSLSASLVTSGFVYPDAQKSQPGSRSSPPRQPQSQVPSQASSQGQSQGPLAFPTVARDDPSRPPSQASVDRVPLANEENILRPFRRSMDEAKDMATSFRYFTILEQDMARKNVPQDSGAGHDSGTKRETKQVNGAQEGGKDKDKKVEEKEQDKSDKSAPVEQKVSQESKDTKAKDGKEKRKVKFDVQTADAEEKERKPAPAPSTRHVNGEPEMIFDLEDEGEGAEHAREPDAKAVLPLLEQPSIPPRARHAKQSSAPNGLPPRFSALRPASLPAYSPLHSRSGSADAVNVPTLGDNDAQAQAPKTKSAVASVAAKEAMERAAVRQAREAGVTTPEEEALLKLVGAETPSHRGAWRTDSKAWRVFMNRLDTAGGGDKKEKEGGIGLIPEDGDGDGEGEEEVQRVQGVWARVNESDDSDLDTEASNSGTHPPGIPASMPIDIGPLHGNGNGNGRPAREPLSLASYQPKTSIPERAAVNGNGNSNGTGGKMSVPKQTVPLSPGIGRTPSARSARRASYAERDRQRAIDPGALDFAGQGYEDEDDEEDDEDEGGDEAEGGDGGKTGGETEAPSRQRALKILKARSRLPAEGMWRSLAS